MTNTMTNTSNRTRIRTGLVAAALALLTATAFSAPSATGASHMSDEQCMERLEQQKIRLQIRPDQEAHWQAYVKSLEGLKQKREDAHRKLYEKLSPEQQKFLDTQGTRKNCDGYRDQRHKRKHFSKPEAPAAH